MFPKSQASFPFTIDAPLEVFSFGNWGYTVMYLPAELPLQAYPRLRIRGVLGCASFAAAWQPSGGVWYLIVSKGLLKRSGYQPGDFVQLRFRVDDQDAVDIPDTLAEVLAILRGGKDMFRTERRKESRNL